MPSITKKDLSNAVLGSWDGSVSVLAVLIAAHASSMHQLALAGLGGALGGCLSMATGEYEGLEGSWHYKLRAGAVLGAFTLFGGLLPTIPFLFGQKTLAYVLALVLAWLLATGVWILKHEGLLGAVRTYLLLIVTTVVTALVPIVFT